jgi:hypothetical protein
MDFTTLVGAAAALCTAISYLPQLKKSWETGETGDLSPKWGEPGGGGLHSLGSRFLAFANWHDQCAAQS